MIVEQINNSSTSMVLDLSPVHIKGIDPTLIEKTFTKYKDIFKSIENDKNIINLINRLFEQSPQDHYHSVLTSVFSSIILSKLEWSGQMSMDYIILGSTIHRIGFIDISKEIRTKSFSQLTKKELDLFKSYPLLGYDLLSRVDLPQQVKQIVFQHKEYVDGSGYPNNLGGNRIFPLARIVSFSSDFADLVIGSNLTPLEGLRVMMKDKAFISRYDKVCLKAFILDIEFDK